MKRTLVFTLFNFHIKYALLFLTETSSLENLIWIMNLSDCVRLLLPGKNTVCRGDS